MSLWSRTRSVRRDRRAAFSPQLAAYRPGAAACCSAGYRGSASPPLLPVRARAGPSAPAVPRRRTAGRFGPGYAPRYPSCSGPAAAGLDRPARTAWRGAPVSRIRACMRAPRTPRTRSCLAGRASPLLPNAGPARASAWSTTCNGWTGPRRPAVPWPSLRPPAPENANRSVLAPPRPPGPLRNRANHLCPRTAWVAASSQARGLPPSGQSPPRSPAK